MITGRRRSSHYPCSAGVHCTDPFHVYSLTNGIHEALKAHLARGMVTRPCPRALPLRWAALRCSAEIQHVCRERHPRLGSYLGRCWLADDDPPWALLVLMGNGSIGCPLIQEPLGRVDTTVLDASFLFKLLTYPVTIMEIAPAGFICRRWT